MKFSANSFSAALLVAGLSLMSVAARAQTQPQTPNRIGDAVQQGNGAYVQKNERTVCMGNILLGLPTLPADGCVNMTQVKFMVTPSGNSTSVWQGTVPEGSRPAQQVVFNSTYTESADVLTKGLVYNTVAITQPDGAISLTLTRKPNGKGDSNGPGGGNGRTRYKGKN